MITRFDSMLEASLLGKAFRFYRLRFYHIAEASKVHVAAGGTGY